MVDAVDQQPVGLDMAFAAARVVAHQSVIAVCGWQWVLVLKRVDGRGKQGQVTAALAGSSKILAELGGRDNA